MGNAYLSHMSGNLLVRTLGVAVAILAIGGVATGAIPLKCLAGLCPAQIAPKAPVTATAMPAAEALPQGADSDGPAAATSQQLAVQTADIIAPTLTRNDVVAGSFALLPSSRLQKPAMAAPVVVAKVDAAPSTDLTTRVVHAVTVHADGTPDLSGLPTEAYAESRPWVAATSPAVDAAAKIGAGEVPVAEIDPAPVAKVKAPASSAASKFATIAGSGANVRSAPTKGHNSVLFALAGGTKVSIAEDRNGWFRITDPKGRSGWVYSDYLSR